MNRIAARLCLAAFAGLATPALADTLTLTLDNVPSNQGQVSASLCGDPAGQFPGGCHTYVAMAPARQGTMVLTFKNVPAGTYALSALHDINGNGKFDGPGDSYGFGNDAPDRPSFAAASVKVSGDAAAHIRLVNPFSR